MSPISIDVLGLGCTSVDDLLYVESYPPPDGKVPIRRSVRQGGGLTATALVAAARLGAHCAFAGTLGTDELSQYVEGRLREEGIDLGHLRRDAAVRPVHSTIVVDETHSTRNIFYDCQHAAMAAPDWPPEELIRTARVLFVDHFGLPGMIRATHVARAAGVPVVADVDATPHDPLFAELAGLVDHVVVSLEAAREWTGQPEPGRAAQALWSPRRTAVVVTCGAEGCWSIDAGSVDRPRHQPAFAVKVVDTTGCGDVFHGAYAAGLAQGLDLPSRIQLAAATAALKATQPGGQSGIPRRPTVEAFLRQRGS